MHLICGINPVIEALNAATRHFDRLVVVKGLRNRRIAEAISRASRLGVPLRFEGRDTLDRLAGGVPHQGIIAVVSEKPLLEIDALLAAAGNPALLMALDGVEDPRNLGAILRTCEAAGADGLLLPQRHSAGLSETVNRASAGALEHVRVARVGNLSQALEKLKERGIWIVGLDASGRERWDSVDLERPVALVVGGEGRGIRRLVRERCDHLVSLPMFGHVASLNVSVVAGIALYEAIRQRGRTPSHVRPIPSAASTGAAPRVVGPRAGDDESDPGDLRPAADLSTGGVAEDDDEHPQAFVRIHDEDLAWGGPEMLRSRARLRGRWQRPGQRPRLGKAKRRGETRGTPRGAAPPAPEAAAEGAPRVPASDDERARRARRRRRRGARRNAGEAQPQGPASLPQGAPREPAPDAGDGAGGAEKRGRRRRRRRRR